MINSELITRIKTTFKVLDSTNVQRCNAKLNIIINQNDKGENILMHRAKTICK